MNAFDGLPLEIINQILQEFIKKLDKENGTPGYYAPGSAASEIDLQTSSYTELISLRLISRTWSKAVIPFYFQAVSIDGSRRAKVFIKNWNNDLFKPFHCPVKRLTIQALWSSEQEVEGNETSTTCDDQCRGLVCECSSCIGSQPVSLNQSARLINLLGANLTTLRIKLRHSITSSPGLIKAIEAIKDLKSFYISFEPGEKLGIYNVDSLSEIFSVIPKLECLSFHDLPGSFNIKSAVLSSLHCFSFSAGACDLKGYSRITQTAKNSLKIIELLVGRSCIGSLEPLFEPIRHTLEGLYAVSFTHQLGDVALLDFPNLRVIRTHFLPEQPESGVHWLHLPVLKNVRTIVTDIYSGEKHWQWAPKSAFLNALKEMPNLKHIVFTKDGNIESHTITPTFSKALQSHGIRCRITHLLTPSEVIHLDYELNGPM